MIKSFKLFEEYDIAATLDVYNQKRKDLALAGGKLKKTIDLNPYRVYWEYGAGDQKARFKNLLEIGVENGDSVLDFGCGLGDLYRYMKSINLNTNYTGVDINGGYISDAKLQYEVRLKHVLPFIFKKDENTPKFYKIKSIDDVKGNFDWILASGVFTYSFSIDDIIEFLNKAIKKCNKGIAFNILPTRYSDSEYQKTNMGKSYMISYNPNKLLEKIKKYFPDVEYKQKVLQGGGEFFNNYDGIFYIRK